MALHLILGNSGSGKTYSMYQEMIRQARDCPDRTFLVIVPEQFTLQTQRDLVRLHPDHVLRNLEVLSFDRLAYRVFSELGTKKPDTLEEVGKNLVLRRVAEEKAGDLTVMSRMMKKPGFISEMKSLISELQQYDISDEDLERMGSLTEFPTDFRRKMADIRTMYQGFREFLSDRYITREEVLDLLADAIGDSRVVRRAVFAFDEFTGFTPLQKKLLYRIFELAGDIYVTVTIDPETDYLRAPEEQELFCMSKKKIRTLLDIARDTKTPVAAPAKCRTEAPCRFHEGGRILHLLKCMASGRITPFPKTGAAEDEIRIFSLPDTRRELMYTAGRIRELCRTRGYRYQDISIVCPDLENYRYLAPDIFAAYQIPLFVDMKTTVEGHPLIEFVRGLFEVEITDFSYNSVFHLLRSGIPLLSEEETDRLDNYVMATGIRGKHTYSRDFTWLPKEMTEEELEGINRSRQEMAELLLPFDAELAAADGNAERMAIALCHLLDRLQVKHFLEESADRYEAAGEDSMAREDREVFSMLMNLLHKMAEILTEDVLSAEDFLEILNAGFETFKVGRIPPTTDRVVLGDITRTRLHDVKVLFLLGVNDGLVPKNEGRGGILSDLERNMLLEDGFRLSETTRERSFEQRFYLYMILTKASDAVYISTTGRNPDGSEGKPSYVIQELCRMFPEEYPELQAKPVSSLELLQTAVNEKTADQILSALLSDWRERSESMQKTQEADELQEKQGEGTEDPTDPALAALLDWYQKTDPRHLREILARFFFLHDADRLGAEEGQLLSQKNLQGSVSKLEKYAECPYSYFLQYGLGLKERQEHELQDTDIGSLYHDVLKRYSDALQRDGRYDFSTVTDDVSDAILTQSMEDACRDLTRQELLEDSRTGYTIRSMRETLGRTVDLLRNQIRRGSFLPESFEVKLSDYGSLDALNYELSNGDILRFSGQIDRVDTMEEDGKTYVKIIDYKSGSAPFDLAKAEAGLQIQILVYMDAALEGEARKNGKPSVPAAVYLYHVKDETVEETSGDMSPEALQNAVLKEVGKDGLVNSDEKVLDALDKTRKVSKNGKSSSPVLPSEGYQVTEDEFRGILSNVRKLIREEGESIREGKINAHPYRQGDRVPCTYCPYHAICGFDPKLQGFRYREIGKSTWKGEENG